MIRKLKIVIPVLFAVLFAASPAFAVYEVYTYGNGDFIAEVFKSVNILVGSGDFVGLLQIGALFTLLAFLAQAAFGMIWSYTSLLVLVLMISVGYNVKVDIVINDVVEPEYTGTVIEDVPFIMGYTAYATSYIGYELTQLTETAFSLPDSYKFSQAGFGYSVMAAANIPNLSLQQGPLQTTISDYISRCVMPDVVEGYKTMDTLNNATDLLSKIGDTNPARTSVVYTQTDTAGTVMTCNNAYTNISGRMNSSDPDYAKMLNYYNYRYKLNGAYSLFTTLEDYVNGANENIFETDESSANTINTMVLANLWIPALMDRAAMSGASDALTYLTHIQSRNDESLRSQWAFVGDMAKKLVPMLRTVIEALLYSIFPFVLIFSVTPLMYTVTKNWIVHILWLQLWGPLYAILNFMIFYYASNEISAITGTTAFNGGVTMATMNMVHKTSNSILAMSGIISIMIPPMAFAIIKGGEMAMGAVSKVTEGMSSSASRGAGEALSGQLSYTDSSGANVTRHGNTHTNEGYARVQKALRDGTSIDGTYNTATGEGTYRATGSSGGSVVTSGGSMGRGGATEELFKDFRKGNNAIVGQGTVTDAMNVAQADSDKKRGDADAVGDKAYQTAFDQTKKNMGDIKGFSETAEEHGLTVDQLAEGFARKDASTVHQTIDMWAKDKGMSFNAAAADLGVQLGSEAAGSIRGAQDMATAAFGSSSADNMAKWAEFKKTGSLTEEMAQSANKRLGTDPENGPFKAGMIADKYGLDEKGQFQVTRAYKSNEDGSTTKIENGKIIKEGTMTSDQAVEKAKELDEAGPGHTKSAAGLRETAKGLGKNEALSYREERGLDSKLATFSAKHGAEVERKDLSTVEKGSRTTLWDNFVQKTGGNQSTHYNVDKEEGVRRMLNPQTGKEMSVSGSWMYETKTGANGKPVREMVGGSFQSGQDGNFLTFFKDDKGQVHYGAAHGTLDNKGKWVAGEVSEITEKEFSQNGYKVDQSLDSSGTVLHEKAEKGQEVYDKNTLIVDRRKEMHQNITAALIDKDDLKDPLTDTEARVMFGAEMANRSADFIGKAGRVLGSFKSGVGKPTNTQPTAKTGADIKREVDEYGEYLKRKGWSPPKD